VAEELAARAGDAEAGSAEVERFAPAVRAAHWLLGAPFLLLLLTGLTNFQPQLKALQVADVRLFAWLHVVLGFVALGAAAWVLLALLPRRAVRAELRTLARVGVDDYLWFQHLALRAAGERSVAPAVGKFNAGQKLNALLSAFATAGLLASGAVLGVYYATKELLGPALVEAVFPWHTALALLALPLVVGHLYLALLHRGTRGGLSGMLRGRVRREWAAHHHPAWHPTRLPPQDGERR
jgi:formate dehydrogenase subunit gamma